MGETARQAASKGQLPHKSARPFHLAAWGYFRSAVVDENWFKLDLLRSREQNRALL
jgi:hypothetical protein